MNDFIDEFLAEEDENIEFDNQQLNKYWNLLLNETDTSTQLASQLLTAQFVNILSNQLPSDSLDMKTKGWKITISKSLLKTALVTATLTTILSYAGEVQLASVILPTIIPMFFEIENIELSKKEEEILMRLPVKNSKKKVKTSEEWYKSLPEKIRKQIHFLDFVDFLDKLNLAGFADENRGKYKLFTKGKNKFRIAFV